MVRLHALELVPDEAGRSALLDDWQALRDAGLPSQLDHRGASNAPHVTVVSAPLLPQEALDVAEVRLGGLLPVAARLSGLLLLGGERVTIARAVDVDDTVLRRVLAVRAQVPDRHPAGWLPHVTLARRVLRADVPRALEVLAHGGGELVLAGLRRWDPELGAVTTLVDAG
ncbi:2'-5' RNA ligase family protein [Nocardioides sp. Root190]|uniref:2'-5' RNA ligase family protein n=1 Tax=Nocardioides sp. Root190 TaxID=1736488 RepID=UPI0012F95E83|nr:2'-5' RNA ligase family protein [Nocardioides sp. Root190]